MSITTIAILVIGLLAVGLLIVILKTIAKPQRAEEIQRLIKQGKVTAAIKMGKKLTETNDNDYLAHYYLGKAYLENEQHSLALSEYKIVDRTAIYGKTLSETNFRKEIATLYTKFNQNDEALKEYILLTKIEPDNPDNYYKVGTLFDNSGKTDQAFNYFQKAIKIAPKHAKAHAALSLIYLRNKQLAEAKREIDLAISIKPEINSSYYYLGKILKEQKNYSSAVQVFEKALRDPEYKQRTLIERGTCYMAVSSYDKALIEFERAIKTPGSLSSPETIYARYFLAQCYEQLHRFDEAIEQWKKIQATKRNFKDVGSKLQQYKDFQTNDSMKDYLTSSPQEFSMLCKNIAKKAFNLDAKEVLPETPGCLLRAVLSGSENWVGARTQQYLVCFFRENGPVEEKLLRRYVEYMHKNNFSKCIICSTGGFTSSAETFAETRPFDLYTGEKLEQII